jgi:RND family efflux transporter MFP subunit
MNKRLWLVGAGALALIGAALVVRWAFTPGAVAQSQSAPRTVPVEVITVEKKKVPVRIEALGNVSPIASVAVRSRLDSEIIGVHFADGATVKAGDLLFTLDSRAIEAQIAQGEGSIARDKAQLAGAVRDVNRYTDLVARNATPVVNLDNAKTQADVFQAAIKSDEALLENLRVQLSYCTIRAPISGRISAATVKVGNIARAVDIIPLATIIQTAPIYVSFTVSQKSLPDIREALRNETATVEAVIPGQNQRAPGQVTMIENTIDPATGMATVRATMPNVDELLWPGTLVTTQLTLRIEEAVTVPSRAIQVSQTGSYVFVVKDGAAQQQPVTVERTDAGQSVVTKGLSGGETVVTDGQLLLSNGTKVAPRDARAADVKAPGSGS